MPRRRHFGSLRRLASGRWQARYGDSVGNRINAPGTFASKADAQRWLSAVETDMSRGDWHDPRLGRVPFGEWADRWLAAKAPLIRPATLDGYRYMLRRHIVPHFGLMEVGRISPVDVQAWFAERHETKLSANTVAKAYRVLKGVLDGAVQADLIARTPCRLKGAGTERTSEMRVATPDQVAAIADAVGPRWKALVLTAAYSGLRWGELAGLRRCDVDIDAKTLTVTRQLNEVNGHLAFGPPKTTAGRRTVGVPSFVADFLDVHLELHTAPDRDGLVFAGSDGLPMRRSNFRRRVWEPATTRADMGGFRFHDLRHTAATLAAGSGASLRALMARIGHASVAAALRYQHVIDGGDAEIVRYLEGLGNASSKLDDR